MQFINFSGPLVLSASTRALYERKLQKLLDNGATQLLIPEVVPAEISIHHNGTADPDLYSDKEDGKKKKLFSDESWIEKHIKSWCLSLKPLDLWTDTLYCQVWDTHFQCTTHCRGHLILSIDWWLFNK